MTSSVDIQFLGLFLLIGVPAAIIDLTSYRVPDYLTYPGMILLLLFSVFYRRAFVCDSLLAMTVSVAFLWLIRILTHGLGLGDVKLGACIGLFCGMRELFQALIIAALSAIIVALMLMLKKKVTRDTPIPFAPFLVLGAVIQPDFLAILFSFA